MYECALADLEPITSGVWQVNALTEVVASAGLAIGALCNVTVLERADEVHKVKLTLRSTRYR